MSNQHKSGLSRRTFLKAVGLGGVAAATPAIVSCATDKQNDQDPPKGKMTYRVNRSTGDKVSILGYGMMRLPVVGGGGRVNPDDELDQATINRLVDYALDHGVNYFDTSPAYCQGRSEAATGLALARHKAQRHQFYVATKLSNFDSATWSREASIEMYHNSMRDLQIDYIDYYLLHGIGMGREGTGMEEFESRFLQNGMLDYLLAERKAGRVRNLGFSYHGDVAVFDRALQMHDAGRAHWDFVQIELNYLDWKNARRFNPRNTNAEYLYNELAKRGIQCVIMEPLLGGRLSRLPDNLVARLKQRDPQVSTASWAFRYAASFPDVLTCLSGMTFMEHLKDNLRTYCPLHPCSAEERAFLEQIGNDLVNYQLIQCNACNYCMPCPYGLNIPAIFVHYNKCRSEGNTPQDARDPNYVRERRAFLVGYDRSVPKLRQADHCIGCGKCVPHCPQRIDIPHEMSRISRYVEGLREGKPQPIAPDQPQ